MSKSSTAALSTIEDIRKIGFKAHLPETWIAEEEEINGNHIVMSACCFSFVVMK